MPARKQLAITERQFEALSLLWEHGPLTVRELLDRMQGSRPLPYTTVLGLLQGMERAGLAVHDVENQTHRYRATLTRREATGTLLSDFVARFFRGSAERLVLGLLDGEQLTPADLDQIKQQLDDNKPAEKNSVRASQISETPVMNAVMNAWIDAGAAPLLELLADWSVRWGLLIAALAAWLRIWPPRQPATRLLACRAALAAGLLIPLVPAWWGMELWPAGDAAPSEWAADESILAPDMATAAPNATETAIDGAPESALSPSDEALNQRVDTPHQVTAQPWDVARGAILVVVVLWVVGVLTQLFRLACGWWQLKQLRSSALIPDWATQQLFEACRQRVASRRRVELGMHPQVASPVFLGGSRAMVLLPARSQEASGEVLEAVLLHELAHAARHDDLAKLSEELVRSVFFFHPLVHWLLARIEAEREELCDASAIVQGARPHDLARALYEFSVRAAGARPDAMLAGVSFLRPRTLKRRIARLLEAHSASNFRLRPSGLLWLGVSSLSLFAALVCGGLSLSADEPEFKIEAEKPGDQDNAAPGAILSALHGQLVDAQGKPVPEAKVRVVPRKSLLERIKINGVDVTANHEATSDAEGRFTIDSWPESPPREGEVGSLSIVTKAGHTFEVNELLLDETVVHVPTLIDPIAGEFPDAASDQLAGRVVDPTGKPIEGVRVDVWDWAPGHFTDTKADGSFRIFGLERYERVEVVLRKPGWAQLAFIQIPIGKPGWLLVMDQQTRFEGTVIGDDGKPVAGATVRASAGPKFTADGVTLNPLPSEAKSDENGRYQFYLQPDEYELSVRHERGVVRLPGCRLGHDQIKPLDLQLRPGITFRAKLVDSQTGQPVAGARITQWRDKTFDYRSDQEGVITVVGLEPGKLQFEFKADGYTRWWSEEAISPWNHRSIDDRATGWQRNFDYLDFDLKPGMLPVTIEVEKGVTINGRVVDPDGNPVSGATAAPARTGSGNSLTGDTRFSVKTNGDGTFRMVLPASNAAEYNLVAHDGGYQQWRKWANGVLPPFKTTPGEKIDGVELALTRGVTVRGRVIDAKGQPLPNCEVRAHAADKLENRYYDPTVKTGADGTFELKFVRPGNQYIQAEPFWMTAEDGPPAGWKRMELTEGQAVEGVELTGELRQ